MTKKIIYRCPHCHTPYFSEGEAIICRDRCFSKIIAEVAEAERLQAMGGEAMSEEQANYNVITPEDRKLLDYFRELKYGEAVVVVKNGLPVMVKRERKDIKLTD